MLCAMCLLLLLLVFGILLCIHSAKRALWGWFAVILVSTVVLYPIAPVVFIIYYCSHRKTAMVGVPVSVHYRDSLYCPKCGHEHKVAGHSPREMGCAACGHCFTAPC